MTDASGPGLAVRETSDGGRTVFAVAGELDLGTAPGLRRALHDAIRDGRSSIAVDVAGLSFLDSTGISVLVDAHKETARQGGTFAVTNPSPAVRRLLELTGLSDLFGL